MVGVGRSHHSHNSSKKFVRLSNIGYLKDIKFKWLYYSYSSKIILLYICIQSVLCCNDDWLFHWCGRFHWLQCFNFHVLSTWNNIPGILAIINWQGNNHHLPVQTCIMKPRVVCGILVAKHLLLSIIYLLFPRSFIKIDQFGICFCTWFCFPQGFDNYHNSNALNLSYYNLLGCCPHHQSLSNL